MTEIISLQPQHVDDVALLHLEYLRTSFRGRVGRHLLRLYYASLAEADGACGFVAIVDKQVVGYVCGVWDKSAIYQVLLRRYCVAFFILNSLHVLVNPTVLLLQLRQMIAHTKEQNDDGDGYELRPIVVAKASRGSGLAEELVSVLFQDARQRGFGRLFLVTEIDNQAANSFYRKLDFMETNTFMRNGTRYIRYERTTTLLEQ
ncbi:MAG: GNAT family N-acetyltransferase [Anaerolineae bacterium]|nr:GNAT family N-acetyltransferase [Anaerolineae bacterium]